MEVDMSKLSLSRGLICTPLLGLALAPWAVSVRAQTKPATDPSALISMTMKEANSLQLTAGEVSDAL
jgi:hypothetical protein